MGTRKMEDLLNYARVNIQNVNFNIDKVVVSCWLTNSTQNSVQPGTWVRKR